MPVSKVVLDRPVIRAGLSKDVGLAVTKTTLRVLNRARVRCPVDTGNLRNSHQMEITRAMSVGLIYGEVFTKVKYAATVHKGAPGYRIYPTHKKALRFFWKGQETFRKWVYIPPRKGRPWLAEALREIAVPEGYKLTRSSKYNFRNF